jgi:hypothetical protein
LFLSIMIFLFDFVIKIYEYNTISHIVKIIHKLLTKWFCFAIIKKNPKR